MILLAAAILQGSDPAVLDRIVQEGKRHSQVVRHLRELCYDIGPRVTGSPELLKAQNWAVGKFRSWGLKNVHLEQWGEVPVGFQRGPRQIGRMVAPYEVPMQFTTMNWTPGTRGLVRGPAIYAPKDLAELSANRAKYKGAWVICSDPVTMRGPQSKETPEMWKALNGAGIAGRVYGTKKDLVHSHGTFKDKSFDKRPTEVQVDVSRSDFNRITRNLDWKRPVVLEFSLENRWIPGPIPQYNVVAEIPGTDKADEVVIVGGHLDSWNSPGSQGANDNGTGVSTAMEAARILMAAKAKPRRTIRFILWSGEEEGLLGSSAYVTAHAAEMAKISATLNDDGGTNYQGGYYGLAQYQDVMQKAYEPTARAFPEFPMKFEVVPSMTEDMGSDHAPFNLAGVPGFDTMETGKQDYEHIWHTQFDRFEEAIPEYLVQSATNHAVVAFNLANLPDLLPRVPAPPKKN